MIDMWQMLVQPITSLLLKAIPDKDAAQKLAHEIATMSQKFAHENALAQLEVTKAEAAHKNLFVAGWRPAVGWTCALGLMFNFLLLPIANMVSAFTNTGIVLEPLDLSVMMPVLMGMLGLGAMRSYEKVNKVSREK